MRRTRFAMLNWNLSHTWEHYGNVVVYLRMKGLVPPTSLQKSVGNYLVLAISASEVRRFT